MSIGAVHYCISAKKWENFNVYKIAMELLYVMGTATNMQFIFGYYNLHR